MILSRREFNESVGQDFKELVEAMNNTDAVDFNTSANRVIDGNYDASDVTQLFYDTASVVIGEGLSLIPGIGSFASGIFSTIFSYLTSGNDSEDLWQRTKNYVDQTVANAIKNYDAQAVLAEYKGIKSTVDDLYYTIKHYYNSTKITGISPSHDLYVQFTNAHAIISNRLPTFLKKDYAIYSLPLYIQIANLDLNILYDIIKNSDLFELDYETKQQYIDKLHRYILNYTETVKSVYLSAIEAVKRVNPMDYWKQYYGIPLKEFEVKEAYRWQIINNFERKMQLSVLKIVQQWRYMDLKKFPEGINFTSSKEIYSNLIGVPYYWGYTSAQEITEKLVSESFRYQGNFKQLDINSYDRVDRVTNTFQYKDGSTKKQSAGGEGGLPGKPIRDEVWIRAKGYTGLVPYAMQLQNEAGNWTETFGTSKGSLPKEYDFKYNGYQLSMVDGFGWNTDSRFRSLDALVYIFKPKNNKINNNSERLEIPVQDYYQTDSYNIEKEVILSGNVLKLSPGQSITFETHGWSIGDKYSDIIMTYTANTNSSITIKNITSGESKDCMIPLTTQGDNMEEAIPCISGKYLEKQVAKFKFSGTDKIQIKVNSGEIKLFSIILEEFAEYQISSSMYRIISALNNASAIDMLSSNNNAVQLWDIENQHHQEWNVVYDNKEKAYQIKNMYDENLVLTWDGDVDTREVLGAYNTFTEEQYWILEEMNTDLGIYYFIKNNKFLNLVLDVRENNVSNGTKIHVYPKKYNESVLNQLFRFEKVLQDRSC